MNPWWTRHKHPASATVGDPHVCDWPAQLSHALDWAVQKNYVRIVRAMEWLIGVDVQGCSTLEGSPNMTNLNERLAEARTRDNLGLLTPPVVDALNQSFPMLYSIAQELDWTVDFSTFQERSVITTKFILPFSELP
jgi:hypothetical protein